MQQHMQVRRERRQVEDDLTENPPEGITDEERANLVKANEDIDALLDEIDGVLENNAETFVQQFTQGNGQ